MSPRHVTLLRKPRAINHGFAPVTSAPQGRSESRLTRAEDEDYDEEGAPPTVDCLQAALRDGEDDRRQAFGSLPRAHVAHEMTERRPAGGGSSPQDSGLVRSRAACRSEGALQAVRDWPTQLEAEPQRVELPQTDDWESNKIKITVSSSTDAIQVGNSAEQSRPKLMYFGMSPSAERHESEDGKVSALAKVKRNAEVSINGSRVSYRKPAEDDHPASGSGSRISSPSAESAPARPTNLTRIPTQKLTDFVSSLERSKRRQLSASREEILTGSPARSCRSQSSVLDVELQVGTVESISMRLRPTPARKQQQVPRFSPLAAWRSLHLEPTARRAWRDDPAPKRPLREQLCRHRPIAQSADSGIGGDGSPPPPAEPELGSAQSPSHSLDQNWMLSRSVPSSLNAEHEVADAPRGAAGARSDVGAPPAGRHIMYLPEYHSMKVSRGRSVSPLGREADASRWAVRGASVERLSPEKPPRGSLPAGRRKFAFQSTLRLIEKKKLEARLSREAEEKEQRRRLEQEAMQRVESEFRQKRIRENEEVLQKHQLRIKELEASQVPQTDLPVHKAAADAHSASSDVTSSGSASDMGFSSHKESPQSSPRSACDSSALPHFQLPARPGGGGAGLRRDQTDLWEPPECPPPDYGSLPPLLDQMPVSLPPPAPDLAPSPPQLTAVKQSRPRFFAGVKNWLRGKKEAARAADMLLVRREEPEGEASSSPDQAPGAGPLSPAHWGSDASRWSHGPAYGRTATGSLALSPASHAGSAGQQPSSGYESSPSLDTSKRLTQELTEYREDRREYRDYRTPAPRQRYAQRDRSVTPLRRPNDRAG
ncbi:uncharacterized protein LOC119090148 [Pollicipes pollicipes]|uniref:uncharacterized protein LOC119090148 n=1 Tax=Pollicipes pollicipes TaxID=41117 RepID=UPI001884B566|nr:uncharacterized protein LOC119090148 [Pollicipes pollicipes]